MASRASAGRDLDPVIVKKVQLFSRVLIRALHPHPDLLEDYRQDLYCAALEKAGLFDPTKGRWDPFIEHVVAQRAAEIIRAHRTRADFEMLLSDLYAEDDTTESAWLGVSDLDGRRMPVGSSEMEMSCCAQDSTAHRDLAIDLATALSALSPFLRCIAQYLLDGYRIAEIARRLHMPYTSTYYHVHRVRAIFAAHQLELFSSPIRNFRPSARMKSE